MTIKVAIIDYGLGNLFSIEQACEHAGLEPVITSEANNIAASDALILPGVGAFGDAMNCLRENNLVAPIMDFVNTGKPFMGICLGMQLLFTESEEFGSHKGLNLIQGKIVRFPELNAEGNTIRVPQIQWNSITPNDENTWQHSVLKNITKGAYMHFVHSYYAIPDNTSHILSYSEYEGIRYASAVMRDNITGIQYHPEKSAEQGIKIYQNWANFIKNKSY
jgi:glutamine amidotransferase